LLGRHQLVRGVTPSRPRIKYGLAPGCLGIVLVIVAIYVVILVALAIQMALYVVAALAALLVVRPFSPALRSPLYAAASSTAMRSPRHRRPACSPSTRSRPRPLVYPLSHGLDPRRSRRCGRSWLSPASAGADGKPMPTLLLRKDVDATPSVGPDLSEPGNFGLWIGEATGTLSSLGRTAGLQRGSNVTLNFRDAAKNIAIFGETGIGATPALSITRSSGARS